MLFFITENSLKVMKNFEKLFSTYALFLSLYVLYNIILAIILN